MEIRRSLRRVAVIALAEGKRTGGSFNRKTALFLGALGLATALVMPGLMSGGLDFDRGLYRVAVTEDAALLPAIQGSHLFQRVLADDPFAAMDRGEVDLAVDAGRVAAPDTPKGHAALAALKQAAKDHTFRQLLLEEDQGAAFPVRVNLEYAQQARGAGAPSAGIPADGALPEGQTGEGGTEDGTVSGGGAGGSGSSGEGAIGDGPASGFSFLPPERSVNTPETLSPPFPFRSLILAYLFLIPMNFVVQVYAGSAIAERLGRKGEPILASPARPWEIILGKALPYFLLMMAVAGAITFFIGGGWLTLVAVAPLAFTFLAVEFIAAMFARSFRELTFLTVFTSVLLTIYAFLPAVFSDVHPISLVSPITLVVFDLRGDPVDLASVLYATLPLTLFSVVLFMLGAALYREEDLFHQKPVLAKAVDSVARQIRGLGSAIRLQVMFLPFVFVAELLLITFLFAWPVPVGVLGILLAVALVEEAFKGIPSYAGLQRGVIDPKKAVLFGALVGVGFFLAEKGFLLASLAGLYDVPAGAAVFGAAGGSRLPVEASGLLVAALLLGPLLLHVVTASISAWGARRSRSDFAACFALAVLVHTTYNFAVVSYFGGGLRL
jgi:ABC-type Na+ efflux pump permease subunit